MNDASKTKPQLIRELNHARQRIAQLEAAEVERMQAALDRVRATVLLMQSPEDMQDVLIELHRQLKRSGVRFDHSSVQVIDAQRWKSTSYQIASDGIRPIYEKDGSLPSLEEEKNSAVVEAWREQRVVYRPDLDREDRYGERGHIRGGGGYEKRIRSVVDVPFSQGTIAVNSTAPDAFSEADIDILRGFARVLSKAYARIEEIRKVEASEKKYRSLVEHSQDVIFQLDLEGNFLLVSPIVEQVTGYAPEGFYEDRTLLQRILSPESLEKFEEGVQKAILGQVSRDIECNVRTKDGETLWVSQITFPIRDSGGQVVAIEGTIRDITERRRMEEQLAYMAIHDPLTGLLNRTLLQDRFRAEIAFAQRNQQKLAVMWLDLDHFKEVNDTLGHSVGDQLLQATGMRVKRSLRKNDTVARMGGDEFIVLLRSIAQMEDASRIAQKILETIQRPFALDDHTLRISVSIGIALYPDDAEDADILMEKADEAMYQAKRQGRNRYQWYSSRGAEARRHTTEEEGITKDRS